MVEKRKYPRIDGILPLKLSGCESDIVTETKNISGSGAYCVVNSPVEPMTKLDMVLFMPVKKGNGKGVKKVSCKGIVVRSDRVENEGKVAYCLGIYFSEMKESDRKNIVSHIDSVLKISGHIQNVF
jgi:c-di-GMP-binding flagellar brake protein YcgR